ncbi:UDP-glucose 4-epimerase GalE [Fusobacterium gastrosuis]|uniref:UDP-glucose 4-epimerase GalE n=1 Tax=Fusobacterium gastrosuis TaxID=1755100 RepID=UPI002A96B9B9|nr:UDP-glucose 4-epimerase GalE [Fusobacterium gastrosuis]
MKKTILVTGGAGYIGSHAVIELLKIGYKVVVIDSMEIGKIQFKDKNLKYYRGNIRNSKLLDRIFSENQIETVMHFAAYVSVPESIRVPEKYFLNNTYSTLCLLKSMKKNKIKNIIFSSTAAVYGENDTEDKIREDYTINPINPYGKSKYMAEEIIKDMSKDNKINYVIFRYFNVAGANEEQKSGQSNKKITALIPNILNSFNKKNKKFYIYGNDYDTKDGTCIRDYIYVTDLVEAHIKAIKFLKRNKNEIFNLGSENGFTVLEIIKTFEKVNKQKVNYEFKGRREGDSKKVIASSQKAKKILGWEAKTDISKILETALKWHQNKIEFLGSKNV